jgi:peptide/nickel transport system permease protein
MATTEAPLRPASRPRGGAFREDFARMRRSWRNGHRRSGALLDLIGVVIVTCAILAVAVGPLIAPDVMGSHIADARLAPSAEHWFGTDDQGRDVFWRVVVGARTTLLAAAVVVVLYSTIGVLVATVAVLAPRWVGDVVMRAVDVMQAFPSLILALLVAALMGPSLTSSIVALGATGWVITARLLAGIMRETLHEPYVEAARTLGVSTPMLMVRHVLPNALPALWVKWAGDFGVTILLIGSMSFIGAGAQPPSAEWGAMVIAAKGSVTTQWWSALFPGLAIALTSMGFALLGDAIHHRTARRTRGR